MAILSSSVLVMKAHTIKVKACPHYTILKQINQGLKLSDIIIIREENLI